MKRSISLHLLILTFLLGNCFSVIAQKSYETEGEAKRNAGEGITFKVPDGLHSAPLAGFKGLLMLDLNRPAGIFITYPNEGESIETLKLRALNGLTGMFIHDEGNGTNTFNWSTAKIPVHQGDRENSASLNLTQTEKKEVQIAIYEREWNDITLIYGYFAMKPSGSKKSKDFLDDKGNGSKELEKFWQSFPKD